VLAIPSWIELVMALKGIPVRIPTYIAMIKSEMKALILSFSTMNSSSSTAETTISAIDRVVMIVPFYSLLFQVSLSF
jgi:hypothetical protein